MVLLLIFDRLARKTAQVELYILGICQEQKVYNSKGITVGFLHEKTAVLLDVQWVFPPSLEVIKKVVIKVFKTVWGDILTSNTLF